MNTINEVASKVGNILIEHFLLTPNEVKQHKALKELGLNHWEQLEMMFYLENEFAIALEDDEVERIKTVGDAVATVYRHVTHPVVAAA